MNVLSLKEAARLVPTGTGTGASVPTVWRWCTQGYRTPSGAVIRLQHLRFGSRIAIEESALIDFARQCSDAWTAPTAAPSPAKRKTTKKSPADRAAQIAETQARVLARCGK